MPTQVGVFTKGNTYKVISLDAENNNGFYIIDDLGQKRLMHFGENGAAEYFIFFNPPLPSLENEIIGWELCIKIFANETLLTNLNTVRNNMLSIFNDAFKQANISKSEIVESIIDYKKNQQEIIDRSLESLNISELVKSKESNKISLSVIALIVFLIIIWLRNC
jgi:predicted small secreted protein